MKSPTDKPLYGVAMVSASEGWAVGEEGTLLHYVNGAWQLNPSPTKATLYGVSCLSPDAVLGRGAMRERSCASPPGIDLAWSSGPWRRSEARG